MSDIRILVTDDSAVIRHLVSDVINDEPGLTVAGIAQDGAVAIEQVAKLQPDVVTLDIEMPRMDGLEAVGLLRRQYPRLPIIMFSTLTVAGGQATLEALARGASDFVTKPSGPGGLAGARAQIRDELVPKIRALTRRSKAAAAPPRPATQAAAARQSPVGRIASRVDCVAIGVSTGGPRALETLVPQLPPDLPVPVVVVQHMPPTFTRLLAERLDRLGPIHVVEAAGSEPIRPGHMYIAPGDHHLLVRRHGAQYQTSLSDAPPENSCRPSVDPLFRSATELYGSHLLAVVLTGMGNDGANGAEAVRAAGGRVIVQDEDSSVVWGMPGAVVRAGLADEVLPLDQIAGEIQRSVDIARAASKTAPPRPGVVR